jgi:hypothetical protein
MANARNALCQERRRAHSYQVVGNGPRDIVYVPGFISHLDLFWRALVWVACHPSAA